MPLHARHRSAAVHAPPGVAPCVRCATTLAGMLVLTASVCAVPLGAQSAQPYSLQAAGLITTVRSGAGTIRGIGIEPQVRFNRVLATEDLGAVSLGVGAQYSVHTGTAETVQLAGLFVEPRWALPFSAGCAFPYLSARAGVLRLQSDRVVGPDGASSGYVLGAGPGVMFRVTRNTNIDMGVTLARQSLGSIASAAYGPASTYAVRLGLTFGLPR